MLELNLVFSEIPIALLTKVGKREAVLREMSGRDREEYLSVIQKALKVTTSGGDTTAEITSEISLSAALLIRCLFWKNDDGTVQRITENELLEFPYPFTLLLIM
jgi:hypothetical protein